MLGEYQDSGVGSDGDREGGRDPQEDDSDNELHSPTNNHVSTPASPITNGTHIVSITFLTHSSAIDKGNRYSVDRIRNI